MKLLYQTHSPFARKVLVFLHETGLGERVEVEHHETSPTRANETVFTSNPLGKVPVLLRPGLPPLFDSDVICMFLDTLHQGTHLIPESGEGRWRALRFQALAQGIAEAGSAVRWESVRRPANLRMPVLQQGYERKITEGFHWLDGEIDQDEPLHIGTIALATALDWIMFRRLASFHEYGRLTNWFESFNQRASMRATPYSGKTHD